jgi:hypothetical protein
VPLAWLVPRVFLCHTARMSTSSQSKLTLVVDPSVVRRAKSWASTHNTSVSALVESYLRNLTEGEGGRIGVDPNSWPPLTRSLFGSLAQHGDTDADALKRKHLTDKYLHG